MLTLDQRIRRAPGITCPVATPNGNGGTHLWRSQGFGEHYVRGVVGGQVAAKAPCAGGQQIVWPQIDWQIEHVGVHLSGLVRR